ncbi:MAG: hypothetical protein L0Y54_03200, partial [Sporichthyaceae bacterium]|nr:hypothetical protein [Sporichthyaceae bacterium]
MAQIVMSPGGKTRRATPRSDSARPTLVLVTSPPEHDTPAGMADAAGLPAQVPVPPLEPDSADGRRIVLRGSVRAEQL